MVPIKSVLFLLCLSTCSSGGTREPTAEHTPRLPEQTRESSPPVVDSFKESKEESAETRASRPTSPPRSVPEYELDNVSRKVPMSGRVSCPPVELVFYDGEIIPYQKTARVYAGFVEHLRAFETIVQEVAIEFYGRAPTKITTYGSYYCRRIRSWPYLISEHGLGNAIDVAGFEFKRVSKTTADSIPAPLRGKFSVSMSKHWKGSGRDTVHQEFLHELAKRVIAREGLFRVILGPADPKHHDHFHFDMAPFRIVNVF